MSLVALSTILVLIAVAAAAVAAKAFLESMED